MNNNAGNEPLQIGDEVEIFMGHNGNSCGVFRVKEIICPGGELKYTGPYKLPIGYCGRTEESWGADAQWSYPAYTWHKVNRMTPISEETKQMASLVGVAINDHICPSCKNDRCSKQETSCWKCGSKL